MINVTIKIKSNLSNNLAMINTCRIHILKYINHIKSRFLNDIRKPAFVYFSEIYTDKSNSFPLQYWQPIFLIRPLEVQI